MSAADLWTFVRQQGLTGIEIGAIVVGVFMLGGELWDVWGRLRKPRRTRTRGDVVRPFINLGVGAMCLFVAYALSRERYLLRPGAGRYTVGTVAKHYWQRGRRKFLLVYHVAGERWQTGLACGMADGQNLPCPALGTRRYVRFSPDDPAAEQLTAVPVPDTLRHVPPLGWEQIP